jgi:putative phosphoesterase
MRIGLVSDTHGALRPEVLSLLRGVDHILHAGDVGLTSVLTDLATIAPVTAVWGNTDSFDVRECTSAGAKVELGGISIGLAHGHLVPTFERLVDEFPGAAVIVHGHSHIPRDDLVDGVRMLNPGSAGPGGAGWAPSVAIAEFDGSALIVTHIDVATGSVIKV